MALKRNFDFDYSAPILTGNRYLDNREKGLELVARIISAEPDKYSGYDRIDRIMDEEILLSTGSLRLDDELEVYARLTALSDRLMEGKYRLLKERTVIGLGGKFSAGKSLFINSLLGKDELPVDQAPTTSVPTYIISGKKDEVLAYTLKGTHLPLDGEAVKAISHGFQKEYGLGLARYILYLSVRVEGFMPEVALLDTPGYNKPDGGTEDEFSDLRKAYTQLRSIDSLIWLLDVQNGTITQSDIDFIRQLNMNSKILIVVNKCDLKTEEEYAVVVKSVRESAEHAGIPLFDVVPYSSMDPEAYEGIEKIHEFFEYSRKTGLRSEDVAAEAEGILSRINKSFSGRIKQLDSVGNSLSKAICKSSNIFEMQSLVEMYGEISLESSNIKHDREKFNKTAGRLRHMIERL